MNTLHSLNDQKLIKTLLNGGVAVLPTDTLYGIVARAADEQAVERVYKIRGRDINKPCIILAASVSQISDTKKWQPQHFKLAAQFWPGALSLIVPTTAMTPAYLHRGGASLAYRIPGQAQLRQLLEKTGPLIAPSANPQGHAPASTAQQAKQYFGEKVDIYVDGGELKNNLPSTLIEVQNGSVKMLRQGAVKLPT